MCVCVCLDILYLYSKSLSKHVQLKSPDIRKVRINNTKIIYKNNNKNYLQNLEAITI